MSRPLLYYAARCPKCVWLARLVTALSLRRIERAPLEGDAMYDFFLKRHPAAKGYPVLVLDGAPVYGARVFAATLATVVRSWLRRA